jgi:phage protein D
MGADEIRYIPDCRVSVGGKKLDLPVDAQLTRVEVDLDVDLFGQCVLAFNDPALKLINGKDFESGAAVKVEMGFAQKLLQVFEGEVVALEPKFRRDSPPSLEVVCQESLHRLALSQMTRAFNDVDDKEIASKIAQERGLTAEAPAGSKLHVMQANVTDAAFLRRLAQAHGNHLRIEGKKLIIGPPPKGKAVTVSPTSGLRKMKVRIKAVGQVEEVTVHGWDPKTKKEIVAKAKGEGETGEGARSHGGGTTLSVAGHEHPPTDVATAEKMAKGRMRKLAEGFVTAQAEMIGDPSVVPGAELTFDKIGDSLDGTYRVEHARHHFSKHGYFVTFNAVRVAKKKPPKPPPAARPQPSNTTWLELELLDSQGRPVPNQRYKVVTADGQEIEGSLDARGHARLTGIPQGNNNVTFPDYAPEWRRR